MKIYAITPNFDDVHLEGIEKFFRLGNEYLQLRDKTAGLVKTQYYVEKVMRIAEKYSQSKIIINRTNNFVCNDTSILEDFDLYGVQQSMNTDKKSVDFCPKDKFNILSCHCENDLECASIFGFNAATLSPVYYTQSHPEQTNTLGIKKFRDLCSRSHIPVFALGGMTIENLSNVSNITNCIGVAMIRGWFD